MTQEVQTTLSFEVDTILTRQQIKNNLLNALINSKLLTRNNFSNFKTLEIKGEKNIYNLK